MLIQKTNGGKRWKPKLRTFSWHTYDSCGRNLISLFKADFYVAYKCDEQACKNEETALSLLSPSVHTRSGPTWKIDSSFPLRTGPLEAGLARLPLSLEPSCQGKFLSTWVLCLGQLSTALSFLERTFHILRRRAIMTCYLWGHYLGGMCLFKPWSGTANQQQGTVPANLELKSSELGRRLVEC